MKEEVYLSERFPDLAALKIALDEAVAPDATRTQWIASCPRRAEYALDRQVKEKGDALPLRAGKGLHAALDTFYTTNDQDLALSALQASWGPEAQARNAPDKSFGHLHLGHLEVVLKNYFEYARLRDMFRPIIIKRSDLNMENVVGAVFRLTDAGEVILGESKLVMEFDVKGDKFLYAGIPDLPIEMGGVYYILDHKSTNAYLSEWYFNQYKFSNQLRGYCLMVQELTGLPISGALINGIYIGERASLDGFKGERFSRYGPLSYQPAHLHEALLNQYYWRKTFAHHRAQGYFPQHASKLCSGCPFSALCNAAPAARESALQQSYESVNVKFLDI